MPRLKFVNLSFNELSMPLKETDLNREFKWQHLRNIVLNSTLIDWESVQQILDYSPTLEELHLSLNNYNNVNLHNKNGCECLDENDETTSNVEITSKDECKCSIENIKKHKHLGIKKLHFTGNPVSQWKEICKLGYAFPNLESLVVANCPINSLDIEIDKKGDNREYIRSESECESEDAVESPHDSFRKLKFLNVNSTNLSTWDDIERLSKFPALHCLRAQVINLIYVRKYYNGKQFQGLSIMGLERVHGT